jgi:hypothetical protein
MKMDAPLREFIKSHPIALQTFAYVAAMDGQLSSQEHQWLETHLGEGTPGKVCELAGRIDESFLSQLAGFAGGLTAEQRGWIGSWNETLRQLAEVDGMRQEEEDVLKAVAAALAGPAPGSGPPPLPAEQAPEPAECFLSRPCPGGPLLEATQGLIDKWAAGIPFGPLPRFLQQTEFVSCVEHAAYTVTVVSQVESREFQSQEDPYRGQSLPAIAKDRWDFEIWEIPFPRYADFEKHSDSKDLEETRTVNDCGECEASGEVNCSCGDGTVSCDSCDGRGQFKRTREVPEISLCQMCRGSGIYGYTESQRQMCGWCNGSGRIQKTRKEDYWEPCGTCAASGKVRCKKCKGRAVVTCSHCDGTKRILSYESVEREEVPMKNKQVVLPDGLPSFPADQSPLSNVDGKSIYQLDQPQPITDFPFVRDPAGAKLLAAINSCRAKHTPSDHILRQKVSIHRCPIMEYAYRHEGREYRIYVNPLHKRIHELDGPVSQMMSSLDQGAQQALAEGHFPKAYRTHLKSVLIRQANKQAATEKENLGGRILRAATHHCQLLAGVGFGATYLVLAAAGGLLGWIPSEASLFVLIEAAAFGAGVVFYAHQLARGSGVGLDSGGLKLASRVLGFGAGLLGAGTALAAIPMNAAFGLAPAALLAVGMPLAFFSAMSFACSHKHGNDHLLSIETLRKDKSNAELADLLSKLEDEETNRQRVLGIIATALIVGLTLVLLLWLIAVSKSPAKTPPADSAACLSILRCG